MQQGREGGRRERGRITMVPQTRLDAKVQPGQIRENEMDRRRYGEEEEHKDEELICS